MADCNRGASQRKEVTKQPVSKKHTKQGKIEASDNFVNRTILNGVSLTSNRPEVKTFALNVVGDTANTVKGDGAMTTLN